MINTKSGKKFNRILNILLNKCLSFRYITTSKCSTTYIFNTTRFCHLKSKIAIISRSFTTFTSMPTTMSIARLTGSSFFHTRKCNVTSSIINKAMYTSITIRFIIPILNKHLSIRLRTSNRMKHKSLNFNHSIGIIAGIIRKIRLNNVNHKSFLLYWVN